MELKREAVMMFPLISSRMFSGLVRAIVELRGGDANCTITDQKKSFQFIFRGEAMKLISEMEYVRIGLKQGKIIFLPGDSNGGYKVSHSKVSLNAYVRYSKNHGDISDFAGDHELRMNGDPTFYYIRKDN